jgi:hypothetical protein
MKVSYLSLLHGIWTASVILSSVAKAQDLAARSPCASLPHMDHPHVTIRSGKTEAVLFLPDSKNGYYRATRFDWSGVVACVAYHQHKFFGEWFTSYDPMKNDSITGPVEEFRTDDGVYGHYPAGSPLTTVHTEAIGYDDAQVGEDFLKPGVGMLKKTTDKPYASGSLSPIAEGADSWTWKLMKNSITFTQIIKGSLDYAYIYTKTVTLSEDGLTLTHSLKNTGTKRIDTKVYDHDFFIFDDQPAGPGMVVQFKFPPRALDPMTDMVKIAGDRIEFQRHAKPLESINAYIMGFSNKVSDYDIKVEDPNRKIGIEQTGDQPISRILFWTNGIPVCPEVYVHVPAAPGKTSHWKIHYRFFVSQE